MHDLQTHSPTTISLSVRIANWIVEIFPRLLGALFIFTAIQKIRQPDSIATVFQFDGLSNRLINPAVWSILVLELALGGMLLLFVFFRRAILLATAALLVIYIAQLGYLLMQNQAPSCGCMGTDATPDPSRITNLLGMARNLCLLWPVIWTWRELSPARKKL